MKKNFLVILLAFLIILPLSSSAAGLVPCGGPGEKPCQLCHFFVLFKNVIDYLLTRIVPVVAILMITIGGFMYVFAYLNPEGTLGGTGGPGLISQANSLFKSVVFGLIIIFAAWIIVGAFFTVIGVAEWTKLSEGWWKIDCPIK